MVSPSVVLLFIPPRSATENNFSIGVHYQIPPHKHSVGCTGTLRCGFQKLGFFLHNRSLPCPVKTATELCIDLFTTCRRSVSSDWIFTYDRTILGDDISLKEDGGISLNWMSWTDAEPGQCFINSGIRTVFSSLVLYKSVTLLKALTRRLSNTDAYTRPVDGMTIASF